MTDQGIKDRLKDIFIKDQTLRHFIEERNGNPIPSVLKEVTALWKIQRLLDRENMAFVERVIKLYGWLGMNRIGVDGNETIFLVVQHSTLEQQEKYLPLLYESAMKGESQKQHLALLEDRINVQKGLPQIYGTQFYTDSGVTKMYPVVDSEMLDVYRERMGLPPCARKHGLI